jgi:hypothetical protein
MENNDVEIIFVYDDDFIKNECENNNDFYHINYSNYNKIIEIINKTINVITTNALDLQPIYSKNIIPVNYVTDLGFEIYSMSDLITFKSELEYIISNIEQISNNVIPVKINGNININEFCDIIENYKKIFLFDISIAELSGISNEEIKNISNNSSRIELYISDVKDLEVIKLLDKPVSLKLKSKNIEQYKILGKELKNILQTTSCEVINLSFPQSNNHIKTDTEFVNIYKEIISLTKSNKKEQKQSLINGIYANNTGLYPTQIIGNHVKHLTIDSPIVGKTKQNVLDLLGLNSAVIYHTNSIEGEFYIYNGTLVQIENDEKAAQKELNHYHRIVKEQLILDSNIMMKEIPLSKGDYKNAKKNLFTFLEIKDQEDLQKFLNDVNHFKQTGKFLNGYQVYSYLINSCRWLGPQYCSVKSVPRLYFKDNSFYSCHDCSLKVGDAGNDFYSIKENIQIISEEEQLKRGCITCPVKDTCSKCTFLPDYMNSEQYCFIRKNQPEIEQYMITASVLQIVMRGTSYFKDINLQDIMVSNQFHSKYFQLEKSEDTESNVNKHIFLFYVNNDNILFDLNTYKLKKIDQIIALILEGLYKGHNASIIQKYIMEKTGFNINQVQDLYQRAINILIKENIVRNKEGVSV